MMKYPCCLSAILVLLLALACQPNAAEETVEAPPATVVPARPSASPARVFPGTGGVEAEEQIDLTAIDFDLLNRLVMAEVNEVRRAKQLAPLTTAQSLTQAATEQTNYQLQINQLSHEQANAKKRTVRDRVQLFGGDFRTVGENVLFQGMRIRTVNGVSEILTVSYRSTAKKMVNSWVESPGHYRNLINPDFTYVGTATGYSEARKALFATQVFGGR